MRRILICSGVLGGGTALVFGAAALTAVLIPPGRIVPQNQNIMFSRAVPLGVDRAFPVGDGGGGGNGLILTKLPAPEPAP